MTAVVQYTSAGLAELVNAKNQGLKGAIKWIAAGSRSYVPSAEQTALLREEQRELIADYEDLSQTQLRMGTVFKGELEYEVREVGFFLESGTLLAVYSQPNTLLAYKSASTSWVQKFTLDISPLPTDSVTIIAGADNINLLLAEELAGLAAATIANMNRHLALYDRVTALEKIK